MFKLSIYEKVENKREEAPMLHEPGKYFKLLFV